MRVSKLLDLPSSSLLEKFLGQQSLDFYTTSLSIGWGRHALAPDFSVLITSTREVPPQWIVLDNDQWAEGEERLEISFIKVFELPHPKSVPYVMHSSGIRILRDTMSTIDIPGKSRNASKIESVTILSVEEHYHNEEEHFLHYDHSLLFTFTDGFRFVISTLLAPFGLIELNTDANEIDQLCEQSKVRISLQ